MLKVLFSLFSFIARGAQLDNRVDPPPVPPHYLACILMNLKHIWMRPMEVLLFI